MPMHSRQIKLLNRVVVASLVLTAAFVGLASMLPIENLIATLNGVFAGAAAALIVAYWRLLVNAILGVNPYDRIRQMTLGFALCWVAYGLSVLFSVYARSSGFDMNSSYVTAISRYIAIIAACLQISAPDFGLGIFHGRDRKMLWGSITIGLVVAVCVVLMQDHTILAYFLPGEHPASPV